MRSLLKVGFALLMLAFVLIALSYSTLRAAGTPGAVNPEGRNLATETRAVGSGISAIDLSGPIDLTMRQGAVASLVVKGEQRLLGNVETLQEGATLHIGIKGMLLHHRQPLQVTLILPSVDSINVYGNGDSTINGFSGERIKVRLSGAGDVKFNGRFKEVIGTLQGSGDMELNGGTSEMVEVTLVGSGDLTVVGSSKRFKVEQTGSGDVHAEHMSAQEADVSLRGSGRAVVTVRDKADLTLRGSGDIEVHGNPGQRNVEGTGSGKVRFL